jgi:predicted lipid-binding transport protein (Tim44 family)
MAQSSEEEATQTQPQIAKMQEKPTEIAEPDEFWTEGELRAFIGMFFSTLLGVFALGLGLGLGTLATSNGFFVLVIASVLGGIAIANFISSILTGFFSPIVKPDAQLDHPAERNLCATVDVQSHSLEGVREHQSNASFFMDPAHKARDVSQRREVSPNASANVTGTIPQ